MSRGATTGRLQICAEAVDAKLKVVNFAHDLVREIYKSDVGKRCLGFVHDLSDAIGGLDKEEQRIFMMYAATKRARSRKLAGATVNRRSATKTTPRKCHESYMKGKFMILS